MMYFVSGARPSRLLGALVLTTAALLFLVACGSAPDGPVTGTVAGTVVDDVARTAVSSATVTLGEQQALTGADGVFRFEDVPPGPQPISVSARGFEDASRDLDIGDGTMQTVLEMTRVSSPTVTIETPAQGEVFPSGSRVRVTAAISGFATPALLRLTVNGDLAAPPQTGDAGTFTWQVPHLVTTCTLQVTAVSADGQLAESERVKIRVQE